MEKAMIYLVEATTQFSDELEEFKQEAEAEVQI